MLADYADIKRLINQEPIWYDSNGVPRYSAFDPEMCPNIYSDYVVLFEIACQNCGERFLVEEHEPTFMEPNKSGMFHELVVNKMIHYGDPPRHNCTGDTMNCEDLFIREVWRRWVSADGSKSIQDPEWKRFVELEGRME